MDREHTAPAVMERSYTGDSHDSDRGPGAAGRRRRRTVPTNKEIVNGRVVRMCYDCKKYINYKNYSHHMRDVHSGKSKFKVARLEAPCGQA
jgi:hypothetical protein